MVDYRIDKVHLLEVISMWNGFLKKKVHLIACGGTALTLLDLKESTKDIDLLVPDQNEYYYLIGILEQLGYKQVGATAELSLLAVCFNVRRMITLLGISNLLAKLTGQQAALAPA